MLSKSFHVLEEQDPTALRLGVERGRNYSLNFACVLPIVCFTFKYFCLLTSVRRRCGLWKGLISNLSPVAERHA